MMNDLNSFLFSTPAMTGVFSAHEQLRAMMRFESALTRALESQGLAEAGAGAVLETMLDAGFVDMDSLQREAREVGNIVIPFVRQLTAAARARSEPASRAIHLGATSQDALDTALVLQMRDGLKLLERAIERLDAVLAAQVRVHRETLLAGRTWLQPGPPTTFGLKLAGTLAALRRHRDRMRASAERALVLQFGGAVGTLSALGDAGGAVSAELARLLELREPDLPWHAQRDNLVEMAEVLSNLTGSLSKFARDVALLMQAEIGEASESGREERGSSSTMPQKQNPVACAAAIAIHTRMPGLVAVMLGAMGQEHERGLGLWQAEWETMPEAFRLAAAALEYSIEIAEGIKVDADRMRENFDALAGMTMAEAISVALAPKIGRSAANNLLRKAAMQAKKEKRHLGDVLKELPEVAALLSDDEIDRLLKPEAYLGSAKRSIERVLGEPNAGR